MATRLLLIEDVDDLGRSGDIVSVKPGYARNYLLPMGYGLVADARTLRMQARLQEERQLRAAQEKKEAEQVSAQIDGLTFEKIVKVDHEGHMYGSVTVLDIVHMLEERSGIKLEKKSIQLKHPLREVGVFPIGIRLKEGIECSIHLKIMSEEAAQELADSSSSSQEEADDNQ